MMLGTTNIKLSLTFTESSFHHSCVNVGNVIFDKGKILNCKIIGPRLRVSAFPYRFVFTVLGLSYQENFALLAIYLISVSYLNVVFDTSRLAAAVQTVCRGC